MSVRVAILIEEPAWRTGDLRPGLRKAIRAVLKAEARVGAVTLLLANDATLKRLNGQFRGQDRPTNVLSFPALPNTGDHLGDIAIAYETAAREALEAGKPFAAHVTHLTVHGALHLLGYDHECDADAAIMEPKESEILANLGIADPYAAAA